MANNYWQFSTEVECSEPEKTWLIEKLTEADENEPICQWESETDGIWLYSEESFDIDGLCSLICDWQEHFGLSSPIIIEWATFCSRPRVDEFSGGCFVCVCGRADWVDPRKYAEVIAGVRLLELAQESSNASIHAR